MRVSMHEAALLSAAGVKLSNSNPKHYRSQTDKRMKRVYSSPVSLMVGHLRNILEAEGIRCFVKNEFLAGGAGELPPTECWPELWVERAIDYQRAERLVRESLAAEVRDERAWTCPRCGEILEAQFSACWKCGSVRFEQAT